LLCFCSCNDELQVTGIKSKYFATRKKNTRQQNKMKIAGKYKKPYTQQAKIFA